MKTQEELKVIKETVVELSDDDLEKVSGGDNRHAPRCRKCDTELVNGKCPHCDIQLSIPKIQFPKF